MSIRERISELYGEETILFDGLDSAIVGVTNGANSTGQVVYSRAKLIEHFIGEGMTHTDACEWIDFNVAGCGVKDGPIIIDDRAGIDEEGAA